MAKSLLFADKSQYTLTTTRLHQPLTKKPTPHMGSPNPAQALGLRRQDLETALDHIRGLLVTMHTADDPNRILNRDLIRTFRALGIPIESISLEVPTDEAAYFVDAKHVLL